MSGSFVLFNGSVFWVSAGVQSPHLEDATRIHFEDACKWIKHVYKIDGFYPVLVLSHER